MSSNSTMSPNSDAKNNTAKRGIIAHGSYVPYWSLDRSQIAKAMNTPAVKGERRVAGFDEDTTTMAVAAGRLALKSLENATSPENAAEKSAISDLWFSTAEPPYLEKTNAAVIHSALRLDQNVSALDFGGASRSGIGALRAALGGGAASTMVLLSGLRSGKPGSQDEAIGGDAAAAFLIGASPTDRIIAEYLGGASATEEFLDRWRLPGQDHTQQWEERFAETVYGPLVESALTESLKNAELNLEDIDKVAVSGTHQRSVKKAAALFGTASKSPASKSGDTKLVSDLSDRVGIAGAAHPGLLLSSMLESAEPNQNLALVWLADGVEILIFRTTPKIKDFRPSFSLEAQLVESGQVNYMNFLSWRGFVEPQPPNRPEPVRISAPAAQRSAEWKHGFVGSRGDASDTLHLPPSRASIDESDTLDAMIPAVMADVEATVATFTVDRLVYSKSPPVIFAIVDFDGGGRFPMELTDVDESEVEIAMKVEMTFRKLYTSEGIHNYFYKAKPVRAKPVRK